MSAPDDITARLSGLARAIEPSQIRALRDLAGPDCLDLGLGQTDLPVHPAVVEAGQRALSRGLAPYGPNLGIAPLREAVGRRYGIDAAEVMVTCGVQEGLAVALLGLVEPGDEVLVPDPGFVAYPNLVRMAGATPVPYPLDPAQGWRLDPEAVAARITPRTRAILLNSPSNPTGATHAEADLAAVLRLCETHDLLWISDEIYEDYVYEGATHHSPADWPEHRARGVRISGVSKAHHMMGWRVGWLTGPPALVEGLKGLHQHLVTCAPTIAQHMAVAALAHHEEVVAQSLEIFTARRAQILAALDETPGLSYVPPTGAFYVFADVRAVLGGHRRASSAALAHELVHDARVVTIPGEGFGRAGEGWLRLAYTIDEAPLGEALRRVQRALGAGA